MIVLEPYLFNGFYQYDPDLGFKVRAYANGTNRYGFNDRDYPMHKDPDTFRILVLGDSFSWAGGRKKNYTAILERKFKEHHGRRRVDVINAGYSMTHTGEQLELLKKYGLQYNPDLVFLGFFMGNDFIDADPYRKRIVVNDVYFDIDKREERVFLGYPVILQSRFFHFVKQKYKVFRELAQPQKDGKKKIKSVAEERKGTFTKDKFLRIEKARLEFFNIERHRKEKYHKSMEYIFHSIDEMKEILDGRDVKFVVGVYPDEFQVNEDLLEQIFAKYDLRTEDYDIELGQRILGRYLDSRQIEYVDMTNEFRDEGKKRQLYRTRDTHWNYSGNELAAAIMFGILLEYTEQ